MKAVRSFTAALCLAAGALTPSLAMAQGAPDDCPYLPAFRALRAQLPDMSAVDAAGALSRYAASHENPEGCEYNAIDRLLSEQEIQLFRVTVGSKQINAQAIYRCNRIDPQTTKCEGPMEDGTAHPYSTGISPLTIADSAPIQVDSDLPGATLREIYRLSLAEALDAKVATPISQDAPVLPRSRDATDMVFVAIYETHDLWRYRKVVWYFTAD